MSWEQLISIAREAAQEKRVREAEPPRACPNDGEPLRPGPEAGVLYCPFDGWQWPRDAASAIR